MKPIIKKVVLTRKNILNYLFEALNIASFDPETHIITIAINHPLITSGLKQLDHILLHEKGHHFFHHHKPKARNFLHDWWIENIEDELFAIRYAKGLEQAEKHYT